MPTSTAVPRPRAAPALELGHYIDGERIAAAAGARHGEVYNPATGEVRARLAFADAGVTRAAIAAARAAFPAWAQVTPLQRSRVLFRFKALLEAHTDELARLITLEHGKVLTDAHGEVTRGLEVVEFACGIPQLLKGAFSEDVGRGIDSCSMR